MPNILISGAASGLGAAFVEAYRTHAEAQIIAIDRLAISHKQSNVESFVVDVTSESQILAFAEEVKGRPIDLFIHSAGIRGLVPHVEAEKPGDVAACETLDAMDLGTLSRAYHVNAAGAFMLFRALLPNLRRANDAKVVVMSSRMGSLGNNALPNRAAGGAYAYRASKAALNAVVRSFAVDVPDVSFIICHPGRVETKLVKCKEEGAILAEESVNDMLPLIASWGREHSGNFYDRFGETIQW